MMRSMSSSLSARRTNTLTRDSSAELTSNEGFSVVAPIIVTVPVSTCGNTASCCALFQRCTSSTNRIVRCPADALRARAWSTALRRSATPAVTADTAMKCDLVVRAITCASVVLPEPGGPHNTMLGTRSASSARRSARPGASKWSWPRISSSVRGRMRAARGTNSGGWEWGVRSEGCVKSLNATPHPHSSLLTPHSMACGILGVPSRGTVRLSGGGNRTRIMVAPAERRPRGTVSSRSTPPVRILIADDDAATRSMLVELLRGEGYDTLEAKSGSEVLRIVPVEEPDLLLIDLRMPDQDGIQILKRLSAQDIGVGNVILMTAYGTSSTTIEAMHLGAYDYITKPFDIDRVLFTIRRYFERQQLAQELVRSKQENKALAERIVGNTAQMQEVYKMIGKVAASDANVLIIGETGAGKESIAEMLHEYSTYSKGPLVKVNLTALPATLMESELFGHEKGSFTGADRQRIGRFERANRGTIFLDEIGDMALPLQAKLLRVLQEHEFERVGSSQSIKVD